MSCQLSLIVAHHGVHLMENKCSPSHFTYHNSNNDMVKYRQDIEKNNGERHGSKNKYINPISAANKHLSTSSSIKLTHMYIDTTRQR